LSASAAQLDTRDQRHPRGRQNNRFFVPGHDRLARGSVSLRRSSLTAAIAGDDNVGLIEVLLRQADAAEAIRHAAVQAPNTADVSFMPAGRRPPLFLGAVDWPKARPAFKSFRNS
jgi:hypothetical protein